MIPTGALRPSVDLASDVPYLATYTLPGFTFEASDDFDLVLEPLWHALQAKEYARAEAYGQFARNDAPVLERSVRAGLFAGLALTELRMGRLATAKRMAEESLQELPAQHLAHHVLLERLVALKDYEGAIQHASKVQPVATPMKWDEPLTQLDLRIATAGWAWRLSDWDSVKNILDTAFPAGIESMPEHILQDNFRLALYRDRPDDAAATAMVLIRKRSVETTDTILQILVQQGWTEQALPLYRHAFTVAPDSALLRRRLVALCLKEGAVDEARNLARPSALAVTIPNRGKSSVRISRR